MSRSISWEREKTQICWKGGWRTGWADGGKSPGFWHINPSFCQCPCGKSVRAVSWERHRTRKSLKMKGNQNGCVNSFENKMLILLKKSCFFCCIDLNIYQCFNLLTILFWTMLDVFLWWIWRPSLDCASSYCRHPFYVQLENPILMQIVNSTFPFICFLHFHISTFSSSRLSSPSPPTQATSLKLWLVQTRDKTRIKIQSPGLYILIWIAEGY